jgi:hypothetical protein
MRPFATIMTVSLLTRCTPPYLDMLWLSAFFGHTDYMKSFSSAATRTTMGAMRPIITAGAGRIVPYGLRCEGEIAHRPGHPCNCLVVKMNGKEQTAGSFLCTRCGQEIEVELK